MDSISKTICAVLLLLLTGCNTSYKSAIKNPNKLNYPSDNKSIPALPVYFDIESLDNLTMGSGRNAQMAEINMYKPRIYGDISEIANNDLRRNVFSHKTPKKYNGHIRVKIASTKISGHYAMVAPSILSMGVTMLFGAPICHAGYECNFVFDVCDNYGNIVKSYPIKAYTREYVSLYTLLGDRSIRSSFAVNFKKAMKQFDICLMNDRHLITSALKKANDKVERSRSVAMDLMEQKGINAFADHIKYLDENPRMLQNRLDKVIEEDPRDVYARMFRAFTRADNQNYVGALSDISAYADVNPSCPDSHPYAYKSTLLNMLNRNLESLIAAEKAVFYDGNSVESWLALGRAYNKIGIFDKGIPALKRSLEIDPNLVAVYDEIRQCEEMNSQQKANVQAYESYRQQQAAMAMANLSNAIGNSITTFGNLVAPAAPASSNLGGSNGSNMSNQSGLTSGGTERVECSNCHGKGTVAGTSTTSFSSSSTYYCNECHREVPSSHSHDRCPSCMGKGYVFRIKR